MSLLYPLYLIGIAAVGLPIAAHLFRRSPRGLVPFGSTMFLRPSPPRVTKRSRLEHWPLLLLRALAVCLLAFAFARPFLRSASFATDSGKVGRRFAIVVDTSASMRRDGLWDAAERELEELLDDVEPHDEVAILAFDHRVRTLLSFEEWNELEPPVRTQIAEQRLADLEPTWGGSNLGGALVEAVDGMTALGDERRTRERSIIVVGDVQDGSNLDRLTSNWPEDTKLDLRRVDPEKTSNAGLRVVTDRTRNVAPGEADVRVRVTNAGDSTTNRFRLQWVGDPDPHFAAADGDREPESVEVQVPPGTARTVLAPPRPVGLVDESLELVGDDHDFDNRVHAPESAPETIRVLYLGNDADVLETPRFYLARAFPPTVERRVELLVHDPAEPPNPALLGDARLVVATDGLPSEHAAALRDFVERGGHLLVAPRSVEACDGLAEVLDGPTFDPTEADVDDYAMISTVDFEHPLFQPFSDARFADFSNIRIWHHRRLGDEAFTGGRVLAAFEDGSPLLGEWRVGEGRVLLMTACWHPRDGHLARSTKFVPLMNGILDASRGRRLEAGRVVVGESIPLPDSEQPRFVRRPDGERVEIDEDATDFDATTEPGVYEVIVDGESRAIAVEIAPDESRTDPLPDDRLESLGVRFTPSEAAVANAAALERQRMRRELEDEQQNWRWILLAVLAVVVAETLIGGQLARRTTNVEATT